MSISAVSSPSSSVVDYALEADLAASNTLTAPTATTTTTVNSASSADSSTSSGETNTLTQDVVALLKALVSGDSTAAQSDVAKLQADLKAQETQDKSGSNLTNDVTSLLKDLTSGNTSAAETDVTNLQADLNPTGTSTTSSTQGPSPLQSLLGKISDALSSGSTQGALQDLASYLVQNGHSTGGLVNTFA